MKNHVCDSECRRRQLDKVHERSRIRRRKERLAKLHGKRPRLRW